MAATTPHPWGGGGRGGQGTSRSGPVARQAAQIPSISEMFAYHATTMANTIRTSLLVFTRKVIPAGQVHL